MAARPRTLPTAVAPVVVGTALAASEDVFRPLALVAALLGSIFIQIGTNLSNDYSDARRGADTEDRLGPVRVTAGGLVPPRKVLIATWLAFGIAVLAGLYLVALVGWQLLVVGLVSIAAGVLYTGGPKPYGYQGLGELFVFLFFGVVAVVGSYYVQTEELTLLAFVLSVPIGLFACVILMVNNIRDIDTDRRAGKRTLAIRLGRPRARLVLVMTLAVAHALVIAPATWIPRWWLLATLIVLPLARPVVRGVMTRTDGPSLNAALAASGRLLAAYSLVLSAALLLSG